MQYTPRVMSLYRMPGALHGVGAGLLLALGLAGCSPPAERSADGAAGAAGTAAEASGAVETVRSWREPVKRNDRRARRRVSLTIDYGDGSVAEHSPTSRKLGGDRPPRRPPGPSAAEIDTAVAAAAADPAVRAVLSSRGATLTGGYPIAGDDGLAPGGARPPGGCGEGSRCYALLAFVPGNPRPVADVVVDLVSGRVAVAELGGAGPEPRP